MKCPKCGKEMNFLLVCIHCIQEKLTKEPATWDGHKMTIGGSNADSSKTKTTDSKQH